MSNEILRIGIVGLGKMGLLHASILNTLPGTELTALCDKSRLIRILFRRVFPKVKIVDDVSKLGNLDLDVIYVTSPISSHFFIVKTICLQRIADSVFVEKTLGSNYDQSAELCRLSKGLSGVDMVGYMKRFCVTFRKARELLDQGVIGELVRFDGYAYSSDFYGISRRSENAASRGGVLQDLGSHIIDLALWFFGDLEVESAKLVSQVSQEGGSSEDYAEFAVKNQYGCEGKFAISWCMKNYRLPEFGLTIFGSKGLVQVNNDLVKLQSDNRKRRWYRHDLGDNVGFLLGDPEYFREDKHFIESILQECNTEPSFTMASKVDYIIDKVKCRSNEDV